MSVIATLKRTYEFNRSRTLALLDRVEKEANPVKVLGWRPGPGRAHIGWQLMHVAITEELFATERLAPPAKPQWTDLVPRFKGGSTPNDDIPSPEQIRTILAQSREHLLQTISKVGDGGLEARPEVFKERGWSVHDVLNVIAWHEPHHQGQAHITLNLYKAANG
jgi:uncharacterized damage-inducible protein DinB